MASKSYELSNLWKGINEGAQWDAGIVFNRTNPIPLDKFSVFPSLSAAKSYSELSAIAYPGQIITVVDDQTSSVSTYKIEVGGALTQIDTQFQLSAGGGLTVLQDGSLAVNSGEGLNISQDGKLCLGEFNIDGGEASSTYST